MVKLKCWRKITDGKHFIIFENKKSSKLSDNIEILKLERVSGQVDHVFIHHNTRKRFPNRKESLNFTNKYMKEHDKC